MYRKKAKSSLSKSTMIMCIANGGTVLRKAGQIFGQILANIDKYLDKCWQIFEVQIPPRRDSETIWRLINCFKSLLQGSVQYHPFMYWSTLIFKCWLHHQHLNINMNSVFLFVLLSLDLLDLKRRKRLERHSWNTCEIYKILVIMLHMCHS